MINKEFEIPKEKAELLLENILTNMSELKIFWDLAAKTDIATLENFLSRKLKQKYNLLCGLITNVDHYIGIAPVNSSITGKIEFKNVKKVAKALIDKKIRHITGKIKAHLKSEDIFHLRYDFDRSEELTFLITNEAKNYSSPDGETYYSKLEKLSNSISS